MFLLNYLEERYVSDSSRKVQEWGLCSWMWIAKGKRVSTFPDVWMLQCCHNFVSVLVVAVNLSVLEITDLSSQLHQHCSHYCLCLVGTVNVSLSSTEALWLLARHLSKTH